MIPLLRLLSSFFPRGLLVYIDDGAGWLHQTKASHTRTSPPSSVAMGPMLVSMCTGESVVLDTSLLCTAGDGNVQVGRMTGGNLFFVSDGTCVMV